MRALRVLSAFVAVLVGLLALAPAASAWPVGVEATAAIDTTQAAPGDSVTITVTHTTPGPLIMTIEPDGQTIGSGAVDANGDGAVTGVVPGDAARGFHVVTATGAGGEHFAWDLQIISPFAYPNIAYSSSCAGPDQVVVSAAFSNATIGETYEVEITNAAGIDVTRSRTATDVAFVLTLSVTTPPGRLSITDTDGSRTGFRGLAVNCAAPATSPAPTTPVGDSETDGSTESDGGATLADTGARTGLGVGLGLTLLVVGAMTTVLGRRRAGTHRA